MKFRFHILLTVLMMLLFVGTPGELQAQTPSPAIAADDEAALRMLAERFYHSMESTDGTEFLSVWSSRSTDDESKQSKVESGYDKVRVESLVIRGLEVSGDTAEVRVKVHMSAVSKRTGKPIGGYFGRDFFATLRCVREAGAWKVLEHASTAEDLAKHIAAADTQEARERLLAENQELVSRVVLMNGMRRSEFAASLWGQADEIEHYDFEKSLILYHLALQIYMQSGDLGGAANLLNGLAVSYANRGDQALALGYYLKNQEVTDKAGPEVRASNSYVNVNIGTLYAEQGDPAMALQWYQKAANPKAWSLRNIAAAYLALGDYARAMEYLNQSLTKSEQLKPNQGRAAGIAGSLAGIGNVYMAQGDLAQALDSYEKGLHEAESSPQLGDNGIIPSLLNSIAKLYLMQGNSARAVEFVERAMAIPRAQTDGPGADLEILPTAGRAYLAAGLKDRARQVLEKAIAGSEYRRGHAAGGEQNRQLYFEQLVAPYHEMIKLLVTEKSDAEAFNYAERSKARALLDVLESGRVEINKALTTEEKLRDRDLRYKVSSLNRELDSAKQDPQTEQARVRELENSLEKTRLEYEAFQTNLYAVHPELSVTRGELRPITLPETCELLPNSNTALLEYVVTDETTYLFVLTKADTQSQATLRVYPIAIKQKDLSDQVEHYRDALAKRDPDFLKPARELFTLLLGPAQEQLQHKSVMVMVPDGVLWELPFQSLQSPEQRYLIENHTVFYAPSLTALREMRKESGKRSGSATGRLELLALGNPVTGREALERAKTGLMDENLEPLPEAERQVAALARLYGPKRSKVYTGAAATEERAKADAPSSRVIQFATHGILNSRSPMYSHLVLATTGKDEAEDGLLEAWEIMKLDLHADLVVLAACETARGRVGAGEGMIGMSWAFFVAGSPTTVASQWKVESASTTELMLEFHRNLRLRTDVGGAPMSKAKALQLASLKLLKSREYRHPFYWAGFVLIGDGY
jgi:CHAT domain-containing protein